MKQVFLGHVRIVAFRAVLAIIALPNLYGLTFTVLRFTLVRLAAFAAEYHTVEEMRVAALMDTRLA